MLKNEIHEVEQYLSSLIEKEEKYFSDDIKQFYNKYKIAFTPIFFPSFYKESFFLILKFNDMGIYFNDVEEYFGICRLANNECIEYADFFDSLAPVIRKLKSIEAPDA